jgi:hypothetical protein
MAYFMSFEIAVLAIILVIGLAILVIRGRVGRN